MALDGRSLKGPERCLEGRNCDFRARGHWQMKKTLDKSCSPYAERTMPTDVLRIPKETGAYSSM
jgi:hypothetical protein